MKYLIVLIFLVLAGQASRQSKYGLSCTGNGCAATDQVAEERMATAKTICSSESDTITYRKDSKPSATEMGLHWSNVRAAAAIAERGYQFVPSCTQADLVVRLDLDLFVSEDVSIKVTDGDSGEAVFIESRGIQDEGNDLARIAMHFHNAAMTAKAAEREHEKQAEMAERKREEEEELAREARRCDKEYDSLRADIVSVINVQHKELPPEILGQIADHNKKCRSTVVPERVVEQSKAEEAARVAREAEAKRGEAEAKRKAEEEAEEKTAESQRNARFLKIRGEALAELQQRAATVPFVPPASGNSWMQVKSFAEGNYYIVLLNEKTASQDCHFVSTGKRPPNTVNALDCLHLGKSPFFLLSVNNRLYALKSTHGPPDGVHAGEVKDDGRTICLRDAGCHQVLAEIRLAPTVLPEKPDVPEPSATTASYKGIGIQFLYPTNWIVRENKRDNVITHVVVSPPEAHFSTWVTNGMFVGRSEKMQQSPTIEGAFDIFAANSHKNSGFKVENNKTPVTVGGQTGLMATYTAPSIFPAGEHGYLIVVKGKNDAYFWFLMFQPGDQNERPYQELFMRILQSVKFD